jgi:hypothetical protein
MNEISQAAQYEPPRGKSESCAMCAGLYKAADIDRHRSGSVRTQVFPGLHRYSDRHDTGIRCADTDRHGSSRTYRQMQVWLGVGYWMIMVEPSAELGRQISSQVQTYVSPSAEACLVRC